MAAVRPRVGWAALVLALGAITAVTRPWVVAPTLWLYGYLLFVAVFAAGRAQRRRHELTGALEARRVEMAAQRERLRRLVLQEARAGPRA